MQTIKYSKQAVKNTKKIEQSNLKQNVINLIEILKINPFQNHPTYEKLVGDLTGFFSRRINIQHRLVYEVFQTEKIVRILRMWTHYEQVKKQSMSIYKKNLIVPELSVPKKILWAASAVGVTVLFCLVPQKNLLVVESGKSQKADCWNQEFGEAIFRAISSIS